MVPSTWEPLDLFNRQSLLRETVDVCVKTYVDRTCGRTCAKVFGPRYPEFMPDQELHLNEDS